MQPKATKQVAIPVKLPLKAHEKMRIAGKLVDADERVEVRNPYTGAVVATVPAASPKQVAEAFRNANAYKPKLSRYDRQKILMRTAEILSHRRDEIAAVITAESGLCWKDSPTRSAAPTTCTRWRANSRSATTARSTPAM